MDWWRLASFDRLEKRSHKHGEHVIASVAPESLLHFDVKDHWEPLSKFLSYAEPNQPYPRTIVGTEIRDLHTKSILHVCIFQYWVRMTGWSALVAAPVGLAYWSLT